jgi:hypothetical protein
MCCFKQIFTILSLMKTIWIRYVVTCPLQISSPSLRHHMQTYPRCGRLTSKKWGLLRCEKALDRHSRCISMMFWIGVMKKFLYLRAQFDSCMSDADQSRPSVSAPLAQADN